MKRPRHEPRTTSKAQSIAASSARSRCSALYTVFIVTVSLIMVRETAFVGISKVAITGKTRLHTRDVTTIRAASRDGKAYVTIDGLKIRLNPLPLSATESDVTVSVDKAPHAVIQQHLHNELIARPLLGCQGDIHISITTLASTGLDALPLMKWGSRKYRVEIRGNLTHTAVGDEVNLVLRSTGTVETDFRFRGPIAWRMARTMRARELARTIMDKIDKTRSHMIEIAEEGDLPTIATHLEDADPQVRRRAAQALVTLKRRGLDDGLDHAQTISSLVGLLQTDPVFQVREAAAKALGEYPLAETATERTTSIHAVAGAPDEPLPREVIEARIVPALLAGLQDADRGVRLLSILALDELHRQLSPALRVRIAPEVIEALASIDDSPRATEAKLALTTSGTHTAVTRLLSVWCIPETQRIQLMSEILAVGNATERREMATALAERAPAGLNAQVPLLGAFTDVDAGVRRAAMGAAWALGVDPARLVDVLSDALGSKNPNVRIDAVSALAELAWRPVETGSDVSSSQVRQASVAKLMDTLSDDSDLVVVRAEQALAEFGSLATSALPALAMAANEHPSAYVREAAVTAIHRIQTR